MGFLLAGDVTDPGVADISRVWALLSRAYAYFPVLEKPTALCTACAALLATNLAGIVFYALNASGDSQLGLESLRGAFYSNSGTAEDEVRRLRLQLSLAESTLVVTRQAMNDWRQDRPTLPPGGQSAGQTAAQILRNKERERGVVLQNHIYKGEAQPYDCQGYDDEALFYAALSFNQTTSGVYPWHPAVRQGGRLSGVLWGTAWAQRLIMEHQRPRNCDDVSFLEYRHAQTGIGSNLDALSQALAYAMHLGRVLVLSPEDPGFVWYDAEHCPGAAAWECWFVPISHCTPVKERTLQASGMVPYRLVPEPFHDVLQRCSPIKEHMHGYWWRTQTLTYFARFNDRTRKAIDDLRAEVLRMAVRPYGRFKEVTSVPSGAISLHVRHRDKGKETLLQPFSAYLQQAELLSLGDQSIPIINAGTDSRHIEGWFTDGADSNRNYTFPKTVYRRRLMFLSTEDPDVVEEALNLTRAPDAEGRYWDVVYCNVSREATEDVQAQRLRKSAGREVLESFLNLELALQASAWICTLRSNWCQLIDRLRMTVGAKATSPYINLPIGDHVIPFW